MRSGGGARSPSLAGFCFVYTYPRAASRVTSTFPSIAFDPYIRTQLVNPAGLDYLPCLDVFTVTRKPKRTKGNELVRSY